VRDTRPDSFLALHRALFDARHTAGRDLREPAVIAEALNSVGLPADEILAEAGGDAVRKTFRAEHERAVADFEVWGVPTFIVGDRAVFVRLMTRPEGDADLGRRTIETVLRLITDEPAINEFKETRISR